MKGRGLVRLAVQMGLVVFVVLISAGSAQALSKSTGGDGYIPFTYKGRIFNIFHHQSPSGNPTYDINCSEITGATCADYPRYFSSTNGSTGRPGFGTPGTEDMYTSTLPQSLIDGSKLYYAAQRLSDNGIGCFDLDTGTNCGYYQLGTLPRLAGVFIVYPSQVDGIERVGDKLYTIGSDVKMYCLDISSSPVACASQPYAVNTGITGQMPGGAVAAAPPRLIIGTRIYFLINYKRNSANARITCFDTTTNDRCASWSSLELLPGSGSPSYSNSLFEFPDTSGQSSAICSAQLIADAVQCWDTSTRNSVSAPPNLFSGVGHTDLQIWEETRVGNKSYFAAENATPAGMAICYDFTTQARCPGFGTGGAKVWDGSDGKTAINNGDTRDYGYLYNGGCMVGLGDAGVLWSFTPSNGDPSESLDCSSAPTLLPDTGSPEKYLWLAVFLVALAGLNLVAERRWA